MREKGSQNKALVFKPSLHMFQLLFALLRIREVQSLFNKFLDDFVLRELSWRFLLNDTRLDGKLVLRHLVLFFLYV